MVKIIENDPGFEMDVRPKNNFLHLYYYSIKSETLQTDSSLQFQLVLIPLKTQFANEK